MQVADYEKAVLSVILRFPDGSARIPQRIVAELDPDKFGTTAHKLIYQRISDVVWAKRVPNTLAVAAALGEDLDYVGGETYLQSLVGYLPLTGVQGHAGFETWVRVVDGAGRLRHLGLVLDKYSRMYADFEGLVSRTADVDNFLSAFMQEFGQISKGVRSSYQHISVAIEEDRRRVEQERYGQVQDLLPSGWPSLEAYFIPRPATLGIIAGISSMGKTQFALQLMLGVAIHLYENGLPGCVAINELETKGWRLARRLACCLAGVNSSHLATGDVDATTLKKYWDAQDYIEQLPFVFDENSTITAAQFNWEAMALHIERGPRVMGVTDYVELFADKAESEELRVSRAVRNQRQVSWQTGSCEIAISQFNNSVLYTADKRGGMGRTRYSGAIGQAADWFTEVYNLPQMLQAEMDVSIPAGFDSNNAYILIPKNKDYPIGKVSFEWVPHWTRFRDMGLPIGQVYRKSKQVLEDF